MAPCAAAAHAACRVRAVHVGQGSACVEGVRGGAHACACVHASVRACGRARGAVGLPSAWPLSLACVAPHARRPPRRMRAEARAQAAGRGGGGAWAVMRCTPPPPASPRCLAAPAHALPCMRGRGAAMGAMRGAVRGGGAWRWWWWRRGAPRPAPPRHQPRAPVDNAGRKGKADSGEVTGFRSWEGGLPAAIAFAAPTRTRRASGLCGSASSASAQHSRWGVPKVLLRATALSPPPIAAPSLHHCHHWLLQHEGRWLSLQRASCQSTPRRPRSGRLRASACGRCSWGLWRQCWWQWQQQQPPRSRPRSRPRRRRRLCAEWAGAWCTASSRSTSLVRG